MTLAYLDGITTGWHAAAVPGTMLKLFWDTVGLEPDGAGQQLQKMLTADLALTLAQATAVVLGQGDAGQQGQQQGQDEPANESVAWCHCRFHCAPGAALHPRLNRPRPRRPACERGRGPSPGRARRR